MRADSMTFRHRLLAASVAAVLLGGAMAPAVGAVPPAAATATVRDPALFAAFGGQTGIVKLVDVFVQRLTSDPSLKPFFKDTKIDRLKKHLVEQLCLESGGGCAYTGDTMKDSHQGMGVTMADYNRLVEVLQDAMAEVGIPFGAQLQLLARLAPMYRDIVEAAPAAKAAR